jgi:hypothetical protein
MSLISLVERQSSDGERRWTVFVLYPPNRKDIHRVFHPIRSIPFNNRNISFLPLHLVLTSLEAPAIQLLLVEYSSIEIRRRRVRSRVHPSLVDPQILTLLPPPIP